MREDFGAISSLLLLFNAIHINKHVTFEEEEEVTKKKKKKKKEKRYTLYNLKRTKNEKPSPFVDFFISFHQLC